MKNKSPQVCMNCGIARRTASVIVHPLPSTGASYEFADICKPCRDTNKRAGDYLRLDIGKIRAEKARRKEAKAEAERLAREEYSKKQAAIAQAEWDAKPENEKLARRISGLDFSIGIESALKKLDAEKLRTIICWLAEQGIEIRND